MEANIAAQSDKVAKLFAPDTPFARELVERVRSHGFVVEHYAAGHHRLELCGPAACGKTRLIDELANKDRRDPVTVDIIMRDVNFSGGNPTEIIEFRPHRAPFTDN